MTTANLMNVSSVKGNISLQSDTSKKLQEENLEVAEMFAGLMNQTMEFSNTQVDDIASNTDGLKTNGTESSIESYERYSYKDNKIDSAKKSSIEEKLEESGEVLEEAGKEIVDKLCEEYGVDEESIQNLLDEMGLNVLDLLNPKNLVSFIVQLTGVASGEELLLDDKFLAVMESLTHLADGLMKDLGVDLNGLQELVAQMNMVADGEEVPEEFDEVLRDVLMEGQSEDAAEETMMETSASEEVLETDELLGVERKTDDSLTVKTENQQENTAVQTKDTDMSMSGQRNEEGQSGNALLNHTANENIVNAQPTANVSQVVEGQTVQQFSSYLSADSVQIMEQIVQQMRVTISSDITTMEMQMNPENLGKVYVNISSEEGIVNAQFKATNEIVKEALETQIATLRENLNQAGVKVDAIEVTIASHEFERNLEQNQQNPEEQFETQETENKKRRNLNMESLDELTGMMTEEEALVAQIMKDNGNSVDFTA